MKVLLATDGSKASEEGALLLAHLPHATTLELTIMSVQYLPLVFDPIELGEREEHDIGQERLMAQESCGRIEKMFEGADVRIESIVRKGHPGSSIVEEATSRSVDLIVLGSLGHSTFSRLLLGSVSDFVSTHAPCSVLVVRPSPIQEPNHRILNVCIAYDGSEPSEYAIETLRQVPLPGNTKYDLLSVLSLPYIFADIPIEVDTHAIKEGLSKRAEDAATRMRPFSSYVGVHVLEASNVGDGVVRFLQENKSDMVVLGDTGRGLLGRFMLGSVSRYVLRHAPCSVLVARHKKQ